ncbi:hypothetical protein [Niallia nealsonii]|uniref:Uncharacterized protein n=1 Tax=Niallia nealsonii TaxID=115979 RepID=A0A2N0YZH1_9BACI|nr:hypothetical protein [Niallia nealsonii]PKG22660.1 hypothetical protein CWS01_16155 [Niallia nealsonii]
MDKLGKILLALILGALCINIVGCSSKIEVSSKTYSFTEEEKKQLLILSYNYLDNSLQNNIIDSEKGEITGFITSGSEFEVFTNKDKKTKDIENMNAILVTFKTKKESKLKSIKVYLDENGEKVLGFLTSKKKESSN